MMISLLPPHPMTRIILLEDCQLGSKHEVVETTEDAALALMSRKFAYADTSVKRSIFQKLGIKLHDLTSKAS